MNKTRSKFCNGLRRRLLSSSNSKTNKVSSWPGQAHGCPVESLGMRHKVKLSIEFRQTRMVRDTKRKKISSWPGLTRPPSARTSVRAGHSFESSTNSPQLTGLKAAPTRVRWVAGSSPAMTSFYRFEARSARSLRVFARGLLPGANEKTRGRPKGSVRGRTTSA